MELTIAAQADKPQDALIRPVLPVLVACRLVSSTSRRTLDSPGARKWDPPRVDGTETHVSGGPSPGERQAAAASGAGGTPTRPCRTCHRQSPQRSPDSPGVRKWLPVLADRMTAFEQAVNQTVAALEHAVNQNTRKVDTV
jgi:hypothetical protein